MPNSFQHALALHQQGKFQDAAKLYQRVLQQQPKHFDALHLLGVIAYQTNNFPVAAQLIDSAIAINNRSASAFNNKGLVQQELQNYAVALDAFEQAIRLKPDYPQAYFNLANLLNGMGNATESVAAYDQCLLHSPNFSHGWVNRGNALQNLGLIDQAIKSYQQAIKIQADSVEALNNLGMIYARLNQFDEAKKHFDLAIKIAPNNASSFNNRGNLFTGASQFEAALLDFNEAVRLKPDYAEAFNNRGNVLKSLRRLDESIASYGQALKINPDIEFLHGSWLHSRMEICDWHDFDQHLKVLTEKVTNGRRATTCFSLLALTDSEALHLKAANIWIAYRCPVTTSLSPIVKRPKQQKIRVGYFSADFHNHATAYLIAEFLRLHDKDKFELVGFSYGPDRKDIMRQKMVSCFSVFFDVRKKSDLQVATLAREQQIDIAIDLKGFTTDSREGIFAYRTAPIQINYLGYPGTMGGVCMDYILADHTVIPTKHRDNYSEKVISLPHSYQVNDRGRVIADKIFTREELGLPATGFIFCCFNNNYKITPKTFDSWMRILKQVPQSVLWLLEDNAWAANNLRHEAMKRGVLPERLVFAKRLTLTEHLARHRIADLFLDTLPYNAHTTASDALWAGLPLLTCMGASFASRVAASLLRALDLSELITESASAFEARAISLASDSGELSAIKEKLKRQLVTAPMFDTLTLTRHIEWAYTQVYNRYQSGLAPDHLAVPATL